MAVAVGRAIACDIWARCGVCSGEWSADAGTMACLGASGREHAVLCLGRDNGCRGGKLWEMVMRVAPWGVNLGLTVGLWMGLSEDYLGG